MVFPQGDPACEPAGGVVERSVAAFPDWSQAQVELQMEGADHFRPRIPDQRTVNLAPKRIRREIRSLGVLAKGLNLLGKSAQGAPSKSFGMSRDLVEERLNVGALRRG